MGLIDVFLGPLYIALTYLYIYSIRPKVALKPEYSLFIYGFTAKVLGMLAFASVYQFYYGGGDTYAYFRFGKILTDVFFSNPIDGIKCIWVGYADYSTSVYEYVSQIYYFHRGPQEWNMVRISAAMTILGANSYLATASLFNIVSFLASWKLYRTLMVLYPKSYYWLCIAVVFAPSALFWGSSIMKDTIGIACVGYLFSGVMRMVLMKRILIKEVIIILICAKFMLMVRSYLLLVSLGTLAVWVFFYFNQQIKSIAVRVIAFPVILLFASGMGVGGILIFAQQTRDFGSEEAITRKLEGFHVDHGTQHDASIYTLGEVEYTPIGILSKLPASLIVTLFRPFPWEIKSAVMAMASLESMLYTFLTLIVLVRLNPIRFFRQMMKSPEIIMCLVFVVILGFVVGLSSYNFGVLVRFKIPLLPFYGAILAILYSLKK